MCNRAVLENCVTLRLIPKQYKTQEMYNKAVHNLLMH